MAMEEAELLAMGARLLELRAASGLKQQQIADYCGVTLRAYQFWQQGEHPPTGDALDKLSELFKSRGLDYATPSYILRGPIPTVLGMSAEEARAHLERIDRKLDQVLEALGVTSQDEDGGDQEPADKEVERRLQQSDSPPDDEVEPGDDSVDQAEP